MSGEIGVAVQNLTVAYDKIPVLEGLTVEIPAGTLTAIVGPNGAVKTTLMKTILRLLKPQSGEVTFPSLGTQRSSKAIAYVPQSGTVDWDFPATVLDVVMMGRYGHLGWFRRPGKQEKALALETLDRVDMADYSNRQISQLSGGQQQRVFLARALMQEAELYFLDEPFKGVDIQTEKMVVALLKNLRDQGKTIVVVHHDLQTVTEYFDWMVFVNRVLIASGAVEQVFSEDNIQQTYGTTGFLQKQVIG